MRSNGSIVERDRVDTVLLSQEDDDTVANLSTAEGESVPRLTSVARP